MKERPCPVPARFHSTAARKGLGEFMAFLANEAQICIAVIAGRGGDPSRGFAESAEAEAGAARGRLLSCTAPCGTWAGPVPAQAVPQWLVSQRGGLGRAGTHRSPCGLLPADKASCELLHPTLTQRCSAQPGMTQQGWPKSLS